MSLAVATEVAPMSGTIPVSVDESDFIAQYQKLVEDDVNEVVLHIEPGKPYDIVISPVSIALRCPETAKMTRIDLTDLSCTAALLLRELFRTEAAKHELDVFFGIAKPYNDHLENLVPMRITFDHW